jgi:hypothetical protein
MILVSRNVLNRAYFYLHDCFTYKINDMKKNMGSTDRGIRILLAIIMGGLFFTKTVTGAFGVVLLVLAVVFLLTSFVSFCPLYAIFGFNTNKSKQQKV